MSIMEPSTSSKGVYLHGAEALHLESRIIAPPGSDEIQVSIRSTTICGSDVHYYTHFANGDISVKEPLCLGHESAGEIVHVGSKALELNPSIQIGDMVALECGVPCGKCKLCSANRYNICPELRFRSSGSKFPHYQGTLQETVNHPARWVHKLPPTLGPEVGALLEPLAVAVQAVKRADQVATPTARESCLVLGAGAVGLLCCIAAQAAGWKHIVIADIDQKRLLFALENGFASSAYLSRPNKGENTKERMANAKESATEIGKMTWPHGVQIGKVDVTFECTGAPSCLQTALYATSSGGSVVLVGMGVPNHEVPLSEALAREIMLVPTWRYADSYPRAIEIAVASCAGGSGDGKLPNIQTLITHRFKGLESVDRAFQVVKATKDGNGMPVLKAVINK